MSVLKNLLLKTSFFVILISACSGLRTSKPTTTPYEEFVTPPQITLPADVNGLTAVLRNQNIEARIQAARALANMGSAAKPAVPALTQNLYHPYFEVRKTVAEALGKIGPAARPSVPILIITLLEDPFVHARRAAAEALGEIGDKIAVPALAAALADEDHFVQIESAISLALLAGQEFPDFNSKGGYSLNQDGEPVIVEAAKEWWENEGRYQDWLSMGK